MRSFMKTNTETSNNTNKEKDLISIIVPIYNAETMLCRCLDSLVEQTYKPVEIILINDGSTDNSLSVCEEYARKASNITVISQENGGAAKARNAGLNVACGEFIMFVDADDYVEKDICEALYEAIKENNTFCVISQPNIIDVNGNYAIRGKISKTQTISGKEALHEMYCKANHGVSLVEVWGKLFHHSMWDDLRFSEGMYYEDLEIMPKLYFDCEKITEVPYMGYYYVTYEESASHGKGTDDKRVWDSIEIRKRHIQYFEEKNDTELALSAVNRLFDLIVTSARNGWVPNNQISSIVATFRKYWKQYKKNGNFSIKTWARYEAFSLGGRRLFKTYHG